MNISQSTSILNRTNKNSEINPLKIYSFNDTQIKDLIGLESAKTNKGLNKKTINLLKEEKDNKYSTRKSELGVVGFNNCLFNQCKYNTDSKDKLSFFKELESDSIHKSNLHDSKSSLDKSHIIKVYEELADIKHQFSKQQNEIKENITNLKANINSKVQEINLLNNKHKEFTEKYYFDSEENKSLTKENYLLKENLVKQQFVFKSTITTLIDMIDTLVFKQFSEQNAVKLNNNVFDNSTEALKSYNIAVQRSTILKEIQAILLNNITYVKKALKIDLDTELEKIENFNSYQPINPLNTSFRFSFFNDETKNSSPKFINEKILFDNPYTTTFEDHNPIESFKDAVDHEKQEKTDDLFANKLDLNDKITDFNYDILEDVIIYQ